MHPFTEYLNPYLGELLHNVALDKTFVRGEGCYLYDDHGNGYLDCIAAYGRCLSGITRRVSGRPC